LPGGFAEWIPADGLSIKKTFVSNSQALMTRIIMIEKCQEQIVIPLLPGQININPCLPPLESSPKEFILSGLQPGELKPLAGGP
jgi:hypothetical protein